MTTYKTVQKIMTELTAIFAPLDAEVLAKSLVWIEERKVALEEFRNSDEYNAIRRDAYKLYDRYYAICGGKTWFKIISGSNAAMRAEFMTKNCAAIVEKRNASIASKLTKAEVIEVTETTYTHSNDGFNGVFVVNTNKGRKVVTIDTIRAGGYNIQCLHLRVLVKLK